MIVTSRIVGYEAERLGSMGFTHATLEDFDDKRVLEFLAKWHDTAEDDAKERARLQGQLERALRESRAVRELAGNPLLLTMMAIVNRNQDLPRDRVELYAQASRVLLHEWDASRSLPVDTFGRQEKEELLRELAGVMQQGERGLAGNLIERARLLDHFRTFLRNLGVPDPYRTAISLVTQLTERNFILSSAGADRFAFVHRTFLEYFCAAWFAELFEKKQTLTLEQLKNDVYGLHWKDETWHEVLRLIAGMVGEKQAEVLILFLMEQDGSHNRLTNLMLAARCLSEVRNRWAIQATDEILQRRFMEEVIRYEPPKVPNLIWAQEPVQTRQKAVELIAFAWRSENTRIWLRSTAQRDTDWIVRMAAVRGLARGWKDDAETLPWLKELARSDGDNAVRMAAVQELAQGWKDDAETMSILKERIRRDGDSGVRIVAVRELARGWKGDPETLPWLKELARSDGDFLVRMMAFLRLARLWRDDPETPPWLKKRARSDNAVVPGLTSGWKDDPDVIEIVKSGQQS